MAEGYRVRYLLICDDVRKEDNGKELLIGVYTDTLIVASIPAAMVTLCFRVAVDLEREISTVDFGILRPDGTDLVKVERAPTKPQKPGEVAIFNMQIGPPVVLPATGKYTVHFGLDGTVEEIGSFKVRLAETDQERASLHR